MSAKRHKNVVQQVREMADPDFANRVERRISQRQIVKHLMALRAAKDISQEDIAKVLGCTQSKVSKLESSNDDDLSLGDFHGYVSALGMEMRIVLVPEEQSSIDEIKYHAFSIKRILDRLAQQSEDYKSKLAFSQCIMETAYNIGRFIRDSAKKVPRRATIKMDVQEVPAEDDAILTTPCGAAS